MSRLQATNHQSCLFSMAAGTAGIQIVATSNGLVIDTQVDVHDVTGASRRQHTTARIDIAAAISLELILGDAITAALGIPDTRQTALFGPLVAPARSFRRGGPA